MEPSSTATDLLGLTLPRLRDALAPVADRPFRADQIYQAIHRRGVTDFDAMTELAAPLRRTLAESFTVALPAVREQLDSGDGTTKYLLRSSDGATIEAVDIPDGDRRTLCLSSQAGCALACAFCVTGFWGAGRNLTAGEIVGQVLLMRRDSPPARAFNLVFMGMGEPLLNLDAVATLSSCSASGSRRAASRCRRRASCPGSTQLAPGQRRPNLAISLHAPDDERRSALMPVNRVWPLAELLAALRELPARAAPPDHHRVPPDRRLQRPAGRRRRTGAPLRGLYVKVNLIPLNPDPVLPERMRATGARGDRRRSATGCASGGLTVTVRRQSRARRRRRLRPAARLRPGAARPGGPAPTADTRLTRRAPSASRPDGRGVRFVAPEQRQIAAGRRPFPPVAPEPFGTTSRAVVEHVDLRHASRTQLRDHRGTQIEPRSPAGVAHDARLPGGGGDRGGDVVTDFVAARTDRRSDPGHDLSRRFVVHVQALGGAPRQLAGDAAPARMHEQRMAAAHDGDRHAVRRDHQRHDPAPLEADRVGDSAAAGTGGGDLDGVTLLEPRQIGGWLELAELAPWRPVDAAAEKAEPPVARRAVPERRAARRLRRPTVARDARGEPS
jgi:23S rRNA (adenine2503-C2)-methyltransferase